MSRHDLSDTTVAVAAATVALHLNVVAVIWVGVHATVTGGPGTTHTVAYGILIACQAVTAAVWYRTVRRWEQERERSGGAVTGTTEPVPGTLPGR